jgi:hypothetical protein
MIGIMESEKDELTPSKLRIIANSLTVGVSLKFWWDRATRKTPTVLLRNGDCGRQAGRFGES